MVCVVGLVCSAMCGLSSCGWHEAKEVIAVADSIDQTEHVIYDDTAALGRTIRSLDNPFGRVLMCNTLGKAYYYMGRNLEDYHQQVAGAARCYIEADRLQIDDPIFRGRINACMGYICRQNNRDSLALIFYKRATEHFKESENEWYYAQSLLNITHHLINLRLFSPADSLLRVAQEYQMDNAYHAQWLKTRGHYCYMLQQYDSALVHFYDGLNYLQKENDSLHYYLKIMQSYNTGNINFENIGAGLIGKINNNSSQITVEKSYNKGIVSASNIAGKPAGIIGVVENNTGLINNTAEIAESYNELGIADSKSTSGNKAQGESDYGSADAILSIKTGAEVYVSIIAITIVIAGIAVLIVVRKKQENIICKILII